MNGKQIAIVAITTAAAGLGLGAYLGHEIFSPKQKLEQEITVLKHKSDSLNAKTSLQTKTLDSIAKAAKSREKERELFFQKNGTSIVYSEEDLPQSYALLRTGTIESIGKYKFTTDVTPTSANWSQCAESSEFKAKLAGREKLENLAGTDSYILVKKVITEFAGPMNEESNFVNSYDSNGASTKKLVRELNYETYLRWTFEVYVPKK